MTSHQADFLIQNSDDGQIYFTLRASNHEVVLTSETYTTLAAANNGIAAVRTATHRPRYLKQLHVRFTLTANRLRCAFSLPTPKAFGIWKC